MLRGSINRKGAGTLGGNGRGELSAQLLAQYREKARGSVERKNPRPAKSGRQNRFTQLMRRTTNSEIHHHQSVTGDHHLSGTGDHHLNVTGDHHASVTGDHHPSVTDQNSSDDHLATFGVMRPLPKL